MGGGGGGEVFLIRNRGEGCPFPTQPYSCGGEGKGEMNVWDIYQMRDIERRKGKFPLPFLFSPHLLPLSLLGKGKGVCGNRGL